MKKELIEGSIQVLSLEDFDFSVRASNIIYDLGIQDVETLLKFTPSALNKQRSVGKKTLKEIRDKLSEKNLCLAGDFIITSKYGIELIKSIPERLDILNNQLNLIRNQIMEIEKMLDGIRIAHSNTCQTP